jgi:hypothetical protein
MAFLPMEKLFWFGDVKIWFYASLQGCLFSADKYFSSAEGAENAKERDHILIYTNLIASS